MATSDDSDFDAEGPDAADLAGDDEQDPTVPCPFCGREIYEDVNVCPRCENFIISDRVNSGHPRWIFWTAALLLAVIAVYLLARV